MKLKNFFAVFIFALIGCSPTQLSVGAGSASTPKVSAALSWTASTGYVTGYYIEQSTDGVNFTQVQSAGAVTSATVSGLTPGQTYYFRIRAYNIGGDSGYSSTVSWNSSTGP